MAHFQPSTDPVDRSTGQHATSDTQVPNSEHFGQEQNPNFLFLNKMSQIDISEVFLNFEIYVNLSYILKDKKKRFFEAIEADETQVVRDLLAEDKSFLKLKNRSATYTYESSIEMDAYKLLGAYIGPITGLQLAILKGRDELAKDIIDATVDPNDLNIQFGGSNTALHLATLCGALDLVKMLLDRGADANMKNDKDFRPIDVADDEEMSKLFN